MGRNMLIKIHFLTGATFVLVEHTEKLNVNQRTADACTKEYVTVLVNPSKRMMDAQGARANPTTTYFVMTTYAAVTMTTNLSKLVNPSQNLTDVQCAHANRMVTLIAMKANADAESGSNFIKLVNLS